MPGSNEGLTHLSPNTAFPEPSYPCGGELEKSVQFSTPPLVKTNSNCQTTYPYMMYKMTGSANLGWALILSIRTEAHSI